MSTVHPFDLNTFRCGEHYAIEASAGTGKTYSIVEIVSRLMESGVDIHKILVVTYTEKAAEELKARIREKEPGADIDNAMIGTIHSFCQKTTEEFCITSGKPSALTLIDESDAADFARRFIREEFILSEITNYKQYTKALKKDAETPSVEDELVNCFCAIANSYYLDQNWKEVPQIAFLKNPADGRTADVLCDILEYGVSYWDNSSSVKNILCSLAGCGESKAKDLYAVLSNQKSFSFDGRSFKESSFKSPESKALRSGIKDLKEKTSETKHLINMLVYKHAEEFYKKWQEEKERLISQTYNDMLRNVREAVVSGGPLLERLRDKYTVAIIDEFQDTNQKQWDIFREVFLCQNHNIIVVGDPKQSIYSFQGSDILAYRNAIDKIERCGGNICSLQTNYRASEEMVECTGNFFSGENALPESLDFRISSCGKKYLRSYYDGSVNQNAYWIWENCPDDNSDATEGTGSMPNPDEHEKYAKIVCQTITDCCTKDPNGNTKLGLIREQNESTPGNITFGDFAILTHKRSEMPAIKKALTESGIPFIQYKDMSVFSGIECAHWIAVLDAVTVQDFTGKNREKFRKALFTRFFGYSLSEINSPEFDKDDTPEICLFTQWMLLAREGNWEALVDAIIFDSGIEEKMGSLKDLNSLGIFRQLGDYCAAFLAECGSLEALVLHLKKLQQPGGKEFAEENAGLTEVSTDFDCVKLMTIHASKGLEFPVVISFGGFKEPRNDEKLYHFHSNGNHVLSLEKSSEDIAREQTEEWQRLFYVAYTRAKYILILPKYNKTGLPFIADSITDYIEKYPYRSLEDNHKSFADMKKETAGILAGTGQISAGTTKAAQLDILADIIRNKKKHTSYKHAYSSLSHSKPWLEVITDDDLQTEEPEVSVSENLSEYDRNGKQILCSYDSSVQQCVLADDFPSGAGLGNAIHEIFELIDYGKADRSDENNALIAKSFEKQGFGKVCRWIDDVYCIVQNVLYAELPVIQGGRSTGDSFRLSGIPSAGRKNEVEFNFNKENEFLRNYFNGFIDLIIKRGDYYSVLDWKSDKLKDRFTSFCDASVLKNHIDECYSIQRVLYSYCLVRWLRNFYPDLSYQDIFEQHFGGVYYVCIRGCNNGTGNGIYAQTWENFEELEKAYKKIVRERTGADCGL